MNLSQGTNDGTAKYDADTVRLAHLSVVGLVSVEEGHELLEEEALGVDLLVDSLVDAVNDQRHGAHQAWLQDGAVALVAHLDLGRLVDHGVGAVRRLV